MRRSLSSKVLARGLKTDLRTSFNSIQPSVAEIRNSDAKPTGLFGIQELAEGPKAYQKITDKALAEGEKLLQESFRVRGRATVVEKLDELSNVLCKVADMADFIRFIHPPHSSEASKSVAKISSLVETLNTDVKLYELLAESMSARGSEMDSETFRVGSLLMHDFEQSGIHLEQDKREQCVKLNDELLEMGQNFMNGTSMPVSVLKKDLKEKFSWMFTPCEDNADYVEITQPFSDYDDPKVREVGYTSFFYKEQTQFNLLTSIILKRNTLAGLCGFSHFSDKVSRHSAIGSHSNVTNFLESLNSKLLPFSSQEFREMQIQKNQREKIKSNDPILEPWDVQYYLKHARPYVDLEYKKYFALGSCLEGLNTILTEVFQIGMKVEPIAPGEVWDSSVRKLTVYNNKSNEILGYIYCDFFARVSKPRTDCHFTIRGGKQLNNGGYQVPIVALLCNFNPPLHNEDPVLLGISQVENLFHEMGHAIHSMVARTRYQHVTGTRCVTDFAEVPSNFLEFFTRDSRVLKRIARHYSTNEPIPDDLLDDLQRHRKFGTAADMQHQLLLATFDHKLHSEYAAFDVDRVYSFLSASVYPNVAVNNHAAFYLRFGHLVGYAAKYYSYLYCKAIANRIWLDLFEFNPFDEKSGLTYKNELLRHGGAKEPKAIMNGLLGEEPSIDSLTDSLISCL